MRTEPSSEPPEVRWERAERAWRAWVDSRELTKAAYQAYREVIDRDLDGAETAAFVASRNEAFQAVRTATTEEASPHG